jgi:protein TonB
MRIFLLASVMAITTTTFAQSAQQESPAQETVFRMVDQMPQFPGDLPAFIAQHIKYPESALHNRVEGRVFLQFVVGPDGTVSGAKVLRGLNEDCDKEALRLAAQMPKWKPGKHNGKPVSVYYTLPINFQLEEKE